jgi:FixJ family two-component response regulator
MKINRKQLIIVVDDDKSFNVMIKKHLESKGFSNVQGFLSGKELFENIQTGDKPIIIQDFDLPGLNGLEILRKVKADFPNTEFIFLSGQSRIEVAVDAIKLGAFDYIVKDNFARENTYNKILNLMRIKGLEFQSKAYKIGWISFAVLFTLSWILIIILLSI